VTSVHFFSKRSNFRKGRSWRWVRLTVQIVLLGGLLGLGVYLELPHETEGEGDTCELVEQSNPEVSGKIYGRFVTSGYRETRSRRVTILALTADTVPEKVVGSVCEERWFLAKLIRHLNEAGVGVIAIDKYFKPRSCDDSDEGTRDLISAVQSSKAPIIVGLETHPPESDPKNACLILSPKLEFGIKPGSGSEGTGKPAAHAGLTRLNVDARKVPLNWNIYESDAAFQAGAEPTDTKAETFSYLIASLTDPALKDSHRLKALREAHRHPFTSFVQPSRLGVREVLCQGSDEERSEIDSRYAIKCVPSALDESLHTQVVLIGEESPDRDQYDLMGRKVSGLYLQANYIESLLDDHYLKPFPKLLDLTMLVGWVVTVYLLFWFLQPEVALLTGLIIGAITYYVIVQLVLFSGFYADLWVQSLGLVALVLKYIETRGHHLSEQISEGRRSSGEHHGNKE
jgi:hypothetical protein